MDVNEDELIGEPLEKVPEKPADYHCNARKHDSGAFQGYCGARAGKGTDRVGDGRCSNHGGCSDGVPEENDNAVSHGAYTKLAKKPLIEGEQEAMDEARKKLDDPSDAKEIARTAASYCLLMGHRSQDPRWFRRFEGLCDKFGIAPEEVIQAEVEHHGSVDVEASLDEDTERRIGQMFDILANDE